MPYAPKAERRWATVLKDATEYAKRGTALLIAAMTLVSCGWRGIANVPLPGGPGTGPGQMIIYVQVPDALAINVNSRVRVADVFVGTVRDIELNDWVGTLTLSIQPGIKLPANVLASIGQTSLLGSQHVQLDSPADPKGRLKSGDTIPLEHSSAFPTTERVLASIATILRGGGIPNLETIQDEVYNLVTGRQDQIREFLAELDTFAASLNAQRDDITRAIDSTNQLLDVFEQRNDTLDRVLTEFPPLLEHFANIRDQLADAITTLGRAGSVVEKMISASRSDFDTNLKLLSRPLTQLERASPYLLGALRLMLTLPFNIDSVSKVVRGDYVNITGVFDLTLSTLDNSLLSGTGFSGVLRALEQSWGRDPNTMLPDLRFSPNPHAGPNGPLVERGE